MPSQPLYNQNRLIFVKWHPNHYHWVFYQLAVVVVLVSKRAYSGMLWTKSRLNNPRLIKSNIQYNTQLKPINPSWVIRIFSRHTSANIRSRLWILSFRLSKTDPEYQRLIRLRSWCLLYQISPEILSFLEKKITLEWIVMKKCFSKNSTKMNCITNLLE